MGLLRSTITYVFYERQNIWMKWTTKSKLSTKREKESEKYFNVSTFSV